MTAREQFILGLRTDLMRRVTMADPKTFSDAIRVALREKSLEEHFALQRVSAVEPQNEQMKQVIGLLRIEKWKFSKSYQKFAEICDKKTIAMWKCYWLKDNFMKMRLRYGQDC